MQSFYEMVDDVSYCRWSCDGHRSDVYVYEGGDGFVIHVACKRGFEHDGENFTFSTEAEMFDRLRELEDMGYRVPRYAFVSGVQ